MPISSAGDNIGRRATTSLRSRHSDDNERRGTGAYYRRDV